MAESGIRIFHSEDSKIEIQVIVRPEIAWLSQKQLADLLEKDSNSIGPYSQNIHKSNINHEMQNTLLIDYTHQFWMLF